jgi:hypothetical protein
LLSISLSQTGIFLAAVEILRLNRPDELGVANLYPAASFSSGGYSLLKWVQHCSAQRCDQPGEI